MNSSEEVKEKFKNTDSQKQVEILARSFHSIKLAPVIGQRMDKLAIAHGKKARNINPELYDLWLDCLMQIVSIHDTEFTDEVKTAWTQIMGPGLQHMKSKYNQ
jgi:hemoglobin-like flavoprotein